MKILTNAPQGSPAWLTARATRFCASEASAALGVSKYQTRSDLLKQKATGIFEEVTPAKQRLFDAGHESERATGPIAESIAGVEFYPAVGVADIEGLPLLASFDGIDSVDEILWENKLRNAALVGQVADRALEPHYWAQLEHQLLVSGGLKVLFTVSDGTEAGTDSMWYESQPERRAQLIAAWKQFAIDLATYTPVEAAPVAIGRAPETLPALHIEVTGMVTASNLDAFKSNAMAVFGQINRELKTDADFANAEKTVKWCGDVEDRLAAAKQHALSQTASIDVLFKAIDDISAEARAVRLELDKLVKTRKESIRNEIVESAGKLVREHHDALCVRLGEPWLYIPAYHPTLLQAVKGKKTVASLKDAVDGVVADFKIEMNARADKMQVNLNLLREHKEHAFLFPDGFKIVTKEADDFAALVKARISEHQAAEAAKEAATRERIRVEEQVKAEAAVREVERVKAAEVARLAREAEAATAAKVLTPTPVLSDKPEADKKANEFVDALEKKGAQNVLPLIRPTPAPAPATPPTLKLGEIGARLGFALTGDFLKSLGFEPAARDKSALLFHEADFALICMRLVAHIQHAQAKQAA